jgi:hypothetical protein
MFFDGEAVFCTAEPWRTIDFLADGFRRVSRRFPDSTDETIVLPPALRVGIRLPDGLLPPAAPYSLDVSLRTEDIAGNYNIMGASSPLTADSASFDETGFVELHLPAAATYELSVYVSRRESGPGFSSWHGEDVKPSERIRLVETDEPRLIHIDLDQGAIDRAVEKLR